MLRKYRKAAFVVAIAMAGYGTAQLMQNPGEVRSAVVDGLATQDELWDPLPGKGFIDPTGGKMVTDPTTGKDFIDPTGGKMVSDPTAGDFLS